MIAEVVAFDMSTSGMTVPLLVAAAIAVAGYFLLMKKQPDPQSQASSLVGAASGLMTGSRLTMLASMVALLMQAGSLRDFAKKLLAKVIEFANQDTKPVPPAEPKPIEEPK